MARFRTITGAIAACGVMAASTAACSAAPRTGKTQEATVKESSNDLLARWGEHADVVVEIVTGVEHYQKGRVDLAVRGDGKADILNVRAGQEARYTHRLAPDALKAFGAIVAAAGVETLKSPPGPREPGDSPVILRLLRGPKVLAEAKVWYADRYDMPALDKVLERYESIVSDATKGALPY